MAVRWKTVRKKNLAVYANVKNTSIWCGKPSGFKLLSGNYKSSYFYSFSLIPTMPGTCEIVKAT